MGEKLELLCFGWVLIKVFLAAGRDDVALEQTLEHFKPYSHVCSTFY